MSTRHHIHDSSRFSMRGQRGAAFIVMIVVLVMGAATILVGSFSKATLQIERDKKTATALAQARDALIGRAVSDPNRPGSLPCPDTHNIGTADALSGNNCPSYIGRLPWKTLGLPDLRDGAGERLWYALSPNFRDHSSARPLNSESEGRLNITGAQTAGSGAAIVFSSGQSVGSQSRSTTVSSNCASLPSILWPTLESNCPTNYLEGTNSALSTSASPNLNYQSSDAAAPFNDRLLIINSDQLWHAVEMRIAREARNCLDDYAGAHDARYPWAAAPTDVTQYLTMNDTLFGRLPKSWADNRVTNMMQAMNALQAAVNACVISDNWHNRQTLHDAGSWLQDAAQSVKDHSTSPNVSDTTANYAIIAGDMARDYGTCGDIKDNPTTNSVQVNLNNANSGLSTLTFPSVWGTSPPESCATLIQPSTTYWNDWRNLVFYQVDANYHPGGSGGPSSLTINGTGNYRAAVIVARRPLATQTRVTTDPTTYLEGTNQHTNPTPATTFESNAVSDANFQTVNDLVLCLDGKLNCK